MKDLFLQLLNQVLSLLNKIVEVLLSVVPHTEGGFLGLLKGLWGIAGTAFHWVVNTFGGLIMAIINTFTKILVVIFEWIINLIKSII